MLGWLLKFSSAGDAVRSFFVGGLYFSVVWGSMLYAYLRNERLPNDSPEKQKYNKNSILFAPFTLPFVLLFSASAWLVIHFVRAILFGVFLLLFPLALLIFRKVRLIKWLLDQFERLGRALLKINTFLLRMAGFPIPQPA